MLDPSTEVCNAVCGIYSLFKLAGWSWQSQTHSLMTRSKLLKAKVVQILNTTLLGSFENLSIKGELPCAKNWKSCLHVCTSPHTSRSSDNEIYPWNPTIVEMPSNAHSKRKVLKLMLSAWQKQGTGTKIAIKLQVTDAPQRQGQGSQSHIKQQSLQHFQLQSCVSIKRQRKRCN